MEECKKCNGKTISVKYCPVDMERSFKSGIDNVGQFMRGDTYYVRDTVEKEHLVYTCDTCRYQRAEPCKDSAK